MITQHYIYISTGETNGFYTLRSKRHFQSGNHFGYRDNFIKNSSRDWDTALKEAHFVAKARGAKVITGPDDKWDLNEWGSGKTSIQNISRYVEWQAWLMDGLMPFGKHKGSPIDSLPESYRIWLRKEADGSKYWDLLIKFLKSFEAADNAWQEERNKILEKRQQEWKAVRERSNWIGNVGQRITKVVTCEHKHPYEGHFGPGYISTLRDQNGNCFKTFGTCALVVGEMAEVKMTIKKHDEWKNEKQNVVTRLAVTAS